MKDRDYDHAPYVLDDDGSPLTLWRGESSGIHYQNFDMSKTDCKSGFFFAEVKQQADQYAARGTDTRAFHLAAFKVLDLTDPYQEDACNFLHAYAGEFEEWVDRFSGEPCDIHALIDGGYLYDYEGNGSGDRWNYLFRFANGMGYDAVRVLDATDGITAPVWVAFNPSQVIHAEVLEDDMCFEPRRKRSYR